MGLFKTPGGAVVTVPDDEAGSRIAAGYVPVSEGEAGQTTGALTHEDTGALGGLAALGTGALSGVTLGASDVALSGLLKKGSVDQLADARAQHGTLSAIGQVAGSLVPAFVAPESIFARSPAAIASKVGHAFAAGEGAGVLARAGAATLGAAAEGSLYGGGEYLSQVALEDKPLSAEGFVGAMGKGALFAAPVGGALSLGGSALQRARALFPQQQITEAAAQGINKEASSAVGQALADGDQMAAAVKRRIELTEAKVGMAEAGEGTTRRVFGQADPAALSDQAAGGVEKAQLTDALQRYQASKAQLSDWIREEADPQLEAALLGIKPEFVGDATQSIERQAGKFGEPELATGTPVAPRNNDLMDALDARARQLDSTANIKRPAGLGELAPGGDANDAIGEALGGTKATTGPLEPAGADPSVVGTKVIKGGTISAAPPPAQVAAREITTEGEFRAAQDALRAKLTPDEIKHSLRYSREDYNDVNRFLRGDARVPQLGARESEIIPALDSVMEKSAITEPIITHRAAHFDPGEAGAELRPGDVWTDPAYMSTSYRSNNIHRFGNTHFIITSPPGTKIAAIPSSASEGEFLLARGSKLRITAREEQAGGRVTLHATVEPAGGAAHAGGDAAPSAPTGAPAAGKAAGWHKYLADNIGKAWKSEGSYADGFAALERDWAAKGGARAPAVGAGADDSLESLLSGMKGKLDSGGDLNAMGAPARAEYAAAKAAKTEEAAAHFRAKANAKNFEGAPMAAEERTAQQAAQVRSANGGDFEPRTSAGRPAAERTARHGIDSTPHGGPAELEALVAGMPKQAEGAPVTSVLGKRKLGGDLPVSPAEYSARQSLGKRILAHGEDPIAARLAENNPLHVVTPENADETIAKILSKRVGKNVNMGASITKAAKAIGDFEAASADLVRILGPEAPVSAAAKAQAYRAATAGQADAAASSTAKAAEHIKDKLAPAQALGQAPQTWYQFAAERMGPYVKSEGSHPAAMDRLSREWHAYKASGELPAATAAGASPGHLAAGAASSSPPLASAAGAGSALGKMADVGTAMEVLKAMGVHVPAIGAIPVIGPVLSLFLKARAVMGVIGRKGGSIGRSVEGTIAGKSAEVRNRINAATVATLDGAARGVRKAASASAGPAVTLGYKLFPGGDDPKSKDPRVLYAARMDEISRALQPGAIERAVSDRVQTADPHLQDAIVAQVQKGIQFLDSKAPKQTVLPGMLPGDGKWQPSKAALEEWGRYVHAVNDPASVLEDLAKGHISMEGAETLRVVYPALFAEAQRTLLQLAPQMQQTMPYPRRVAISIMYQVPVDGTMTPSHIQYLQPPPGGVPPAPAQGGSMPGGSGAPGAGGGAAFTAPLNLGQQMMPSLDRRAGA